jgi:hypothetical protein
MKNNDLNIVDTIFALLPDAVGEMSVKVSFLKCVDGIITDNERSVHVLCGVSDENLHDTVERIARYLDTVRTNYRCEQQARKFWETDWNNPALWAGDIVVEFNDW